MADASSAIELGANASAVNALANERAVALATPVTRAVALATPLAYSGLFFDPTNGSETYDDYFASGYATPIYAGAPVFNP